MQSEPQAPPELLAIAARTLREDEKLIFQRSGVGSKRKSSVVLSKQSTRTVGGRLACDYGCSLSLRILGLKPESIELLISTFAIGDNFNWIVSETAIASRYYVSPSCVIFATRSTNALDSL
jgi:hypothetical protein